MKKNSKKLHKVQPWCWTIQPKFVISGKHVNINEQYSAKDGTTEMLISQWSPQSEGTNVEKQEMIWQLSNDLEFHIPLICVCSRFEGVGLEPDLH